MSEPVTVRFEPMKLHDLPENPLRAYLVLPLRDDNGCWFVVPVASAPIEGLEHLITVAVERATKRMRRKVSS